MLFVVLEEQGVSIANIEDLVGWLKTQDKDGIHDVIMKIARKLDPTEPILNESDEIFRNHQLFCAHVERYLILKEAIKSGDVGLLRHALQHAAVLFNSGETSTPRYAQALLYTVHMVGSTATSKAFQRFVLANMLVNLQGKADGFIENDRCLELENNRHRKHITRRMMTGTAESDENIATWALLGRMLDRFRTAMQLSFGWRVNRDHTYNNAYEDIFAMAQYLSHSSIRPQNHARSSRYKAADLIKLAIERLPEAITNYNERQCQLTTFIEEPSTDAECQSPSDDPIGLLDEEDIQLLDPDDQRMEFDREFGLQDNDDLDASFMESFDNV